MSKILVSACLLGDRVRYDGEIKKPDPRLMQLYVDGKVIPCCPEVDGGLAVPRLPAEIVCGDGIDVLAGECDIERKDGTSVCDAFLKGANRAYALAVKYNIKIAILKSKSPSCSNNYIYDGTFSGKLKEGMGVTTALLQAQGIYVYNEEEIDEAIAHFVAL